MDYAAQVDWSKGIDLEWMVPMTRKEMIEKFGQNEAEFFLGQGPMYHTVSALSLEPLPAKLFDATFWQLANTDSHSETEDTPPIALINADIQDTDLDSLITWLAQSKLPQADAIQTWVTQQRNTQPPSAWPLNIVFKSLPEGSSAEPVDPARDDHVHWGKTVDPAFDCAAQVDWSKGIDLEWLQPITTDTPSGEPPYRVVDTLGLAPFSVSSDMFDEMFWTLARTQTDILAQTKAQPPVMILGIYSVFSDVESEFFSLWLGRSRVPQSEIIAIQTWMTQQRERHGLCDWPLRIVFRSLPQTQPLAH